MKRILGLDVGDKTIGVAVSDELGLTAQGVTVRRRLSLADDIAFLREICALYDATAIVIGLPKNMDGSLGPQAQKTLAFIERVRRACAVPVIDWDERLTSQAAERVLLEANTSRRRRNQLRDRLAAQLILQAYLEWRTRHPSASLSMPGRTTSSAKGFPPEDETAEAEHKEMRKPDTDQQR
jgi:putative Holliday junction resolvase